MRHCPHCGLRSEKGQAACMRIGPEYGARCALASDPVALAAAWGEGYAAGQDSLSGPTGEYVDDPRLKNPYEGTHPNEPESSAQSPSNALGISDG